MFIPLYSIGHLDWQPVLKKTAPQGSEEFALHYIELVRAHRFDDALKDTEADTLGKQPKDFLSKAAMFFPEGEPKSMKMVGVNILKATVTGETTYHLLFEYEYDKAWVGVEAVLHNPGAYTLVALNVWRLPDSVEHLNRFTFEGKGYLHYMVLALAVTMLLLNLVVFVWCVRQANLKNKWLWCLFILVGVFQISFNWTTGNFAWLSSYDTQGTSYDFFYIGLPPVQFYQVPYGPLIVRFSLPIGLMVFLSRYPLRRK